MIKSIFFNDSVVRYTEGFSGNSIFNTKDICDSLNIDMPQNYMNAVDFPTFMGLVCSHSKLYDHLFDQLVGINKEPECSIPETDVDWSNLV
ncbi:hypothetical protein CGJ96_22840 [Vibrio parahaemolyticus]|uniref:hypothetical protein n=1 Tax=Vibrio parahaemolyticus TaxID=670 RepID=UPI001166D5F2|nr:hypothetical protein [Vibrio parahaemolyticus]TOB91167.1 hypothetical protein CGJ96_22840 [Vibrio parahaemolyticus]